jgi:hypothetical protein
LFGLLLLLLDCWLPERLSEEDDLLLLEVDADAEEFFLSRLISD